jgi:biopolymer transport protein ExbD
MAINTRARAMREARRVQQFSKFRLITLNLVPLVDTFVSIVFFALTTQTVGEMAPMAPGVTLPVSTNTEVALHELTIGIGPQLTLEGQPIMSTRAAAQAVSNDPQQPLLIPELFAVLRSRADSIRNSNNIDDNQPVTAPLAIQAEKSMRYDLLSRVMQTARLAGFRNITLQVLRENQEGATPRAS